MNKDALIHGSGGNTGLSRPQFRSLFILGEAPGTLATWEMFRDTEAGQACLGRLTHLRFEQAISPISIPLRNCLNITHLALPYPRYTSGPGAFAAISFILGSNSSRSLQRLILVCKTAEPLSQRDKAEVDHFIKTGCRTPSSYAVYVAFAEHDPSPEEWWEEVNGGRSVWNSAVPFDSLMVPEK
ncbi:hypothetical protein OE88DRAFT_1654308 [Heliocybe sulcata]|uniref:Uncharacterized protein n=1 Tax=Heliocybe sulcata TaxID=5364 RepID=A0A5C3N9A0_9AGAM|nr:hypothetical protein OE88DRAFT_1654308 [Heliocybe sulcata]